jgi:hypothetical protein
MSLTIIIILVGTAIAIIPGIKIAKVNIPFYNYILLFLGIVLITLSIGKAVIDNKEDNLKKTAINNLTHKIGSLNFSIDTMRKDNLSFLKYLKDSLGIERNGNTVIIASKNIFNTFYDIHHDAEAASALTSENNYIYRISKDTFFIAPKDGVWLRSTLYIDTSKKPHYDEGIGRVFNEEFTIDGKRYITRATSTMERSVTNDMPFFAVIPKLKDTYVIFGDDADPTKKYLYKSGMVKWIPNHYSVKTNIQPGQTNE